MKAAAIWKSMFGRRTRRTYAERIDAEREIYKDNCHINDLPKICFYWLNRHILPQLADLGYADVDSFFAASLQQVYGRSARDLRRFVSVGSGNCDTEIRLAVALRASGAKAFVIDCLDLNEHMLERGRASAAEQGVAEHIKLICGDFNDWRPDDQYDAVLASQSLHHVVELETLLDAIYDCLQPEGIVVVSDMIGRNGHRRWPEALGLVQQFWAELPERYRYNRQLRRQEDEYPDWDCSLEGFEGIRSQDILPLLLERFGFQFFFAFSNVTDPFIDRSFGPNFDAASEWDRAFIDRVHACDEAGISAGRITPTHMLAVLSRTATQNLKCRKHLTPEFCVRRP